MNLKFLETFVWVARLKSFRLTADKLFTTQASVSGRIASLEQELGVSLFLRGSRGVVLTAEGQRVMEYAERMLETEQALKRALLSDDQLQGHLRIGAMDTVMHTWLVPLVSRIQQRYPAVEIELTADTAHNLGEQLEKGHLDIAFQTDILRSDDLRNQPLAKLALHWVGSSRMLEDEPVLGALAEQRIITFSKHSRPHQDILVLLQRERVLAPRISCVNSIAAMVRLVSDGFGIGVLPTVLVKQALAEGRLRLLQHLPSPPPMDIIASWRCGAGLALHETVVRLARETLVDYRQEAGDQLLLL